MSWEPGEPIVRREVLNDGRPWLGAMVYVVEDSDDQLVTYLPGGTEFGFLDGQFPTRSGQHPWNHGSRSWEGHGTLMVQRPGEDHAVWHFWDDPNRSFQCWYVNLQEAFRRTAIGYDTQDLELDIVVALDGSWAFKDQELLAEHVERGRYRAEQVDEVLTLGHELSAKLEAGKHWWDDAWSRWRPETSWSPIPLPPGWADVPTR